MGKSVRSNTPVTASDFFGPINPEDHPFQGAQGKETSRTTSFNPAQFEYSDNASIYDDPDALSAEQSVKQPLSDVLIRTGKQFGANVISSVGQGLANTFDFGSIAHTAKSEVDGGKDDFNSSLFGLTTRDMMQWANNVAQRNQIYQNKPGAFDPTDMAWWGNQIASSGTGIGMGLEALGETAAIEYASGGFGTAAALARLGKLGKNIINGMRGAKALEEAVSVAKGLRSAATVYGVMSRLNESRSEGLQSYDEIKQDLSARTNPDGSPKFTKDQVEQLASDGARRTFNGNLALMPLDIIGYRTMVFNPISGAGEGLIEKAIGKIGNKVARKATQFGVEALLEGSEEGAQNIFQGEGKHYAQLLGGINDHTTLLDRVNSQVKSDDFWNNFAGGVIGSPVIGGVMGLVNRVTSGNRAAMLGEMHKEFIKNIGTMTDDYGNKIKGFEAEGKTQEAEIARRQFHALKALSALHLDAMTDKETAFEAHKAFIEGTLAELKEGKTDALGDLGFTNPSKDQIEKATKEFETYSKDAGDMQRIYDEVKDKYNKNVVPEVTFDHFQLENLIKEKNQLQTKLSTQSANLSQFDELSEHGKQIYNTEYQLKALNHELNRLTELHRNTENTFDKQDVSSQLEEVKSKITKVNDKLQEVQKDDGYDPETKKKDNSIIGSALRSNSYQQDVHDSERLDNEIALKRKEVARWNDKEYIAEKNKLAIKNAKTQAQVDATKQNIINNGKDQKDTQAAISDKEAELAANRAKEALQEEGQKPKGSNEVPGNSNLFDDSQADEHINNLKSAVSSIQPTSVIATAPDTGRETGGEAAPPEAEAGMVNGKEEFLLSPEDYDFKNSPDEAKQKIKDGVQGLLNKLGDKPSFEDLAREVIKSQGKDTADKIYNALKYGWEANGNQAVDYNAIYDKLFNPLGTLMQGVQGLITSTKELGEQTKKVEDDLAEQSGKPKGFNNENQPIYVYQNQEGKRTYVTNESSPKLAFTSRLSELQSTTNDDGTVSVSYEYSEGELNTSQYVDSKPLLDPNQWNEGTQAEVRVPDNYMDILIPVYNQDGTKGKAMTFGQYVAEKHLSPEDQEYKDKLPMVIFRKGAAKDEKGVAFVHDIGWYHPLRFNAEAKDDMQKAIDNTRNIREGVIKAGNKADIEITGKRQTTFSGLKTKENELVTLREANPQTKLTIARNTETLETSKNVNFENDNRSIINKSPYKIGGVYDVRRFGNKDGKETHVALPVFNQKLDGEGLASVAMAIAVYANRNNQDKGTRDKHDAIVKSIQDNMKIDILSSQGIEKYLKHFITTFNVTAKTNAEVEEQAKAKLPLGTPYMAIIYGGNIVFGQAGVKQTTTVGSYFINPNSQKNQFGLNALNKSITVNKTTYPSFLHWYQQNTSQEGLTENRPVVTIDRSGATKTSAPSYNDYLLDRLKSNIKSVNIGNEEKPNYVTNIQPVITYDLKSNLKSNETAQQVKQEVIEKLESGDKAEQGKEENKDNEDTTRLKEDALSRLRSLGINVDLNSTTTEEEELFDPAELSDKQRAEVDKDITRIAGLTPEQQGTVVNFMFNQIVPLIDSKGGKIVKSEADKEVEKAYNEVVSKIRETYQQEHDRVEQLLKDFPDMQNSGLPRANKELKLRINQIDSIKENLDTLKKLAFDKVEKYTGAKQSKEEVSFNDGNEEEENANEENNTNEETTGKEKDFWTDVLTESPDHKLTYEMRRFFGQIRMRDKNGEPVTGFLTLPIYEDASLVSATLMTTLADVPSNFDTMMAKLESRKAAIPFMDEVINRLKGSSQQKKNQFVTVMSNHSLRMKFTMLSFNNKTQTWTAKVYNTNQSGVADAIRNQWSNNIIDTDLVIGNKDGTYSLNIERAKHLMQQFEAWKGVSIPKLSDSELMSGVRDNIKLGSPVTFTPPVNSPLANELKSKLVKNSDRIGFSLKGFDYQISKVGDKFKAEFLQSTTATDEEVKSWLANFGIDLHPQAFKELKEKGLFHGAKQVSYNGLFDVKIDTARGEITGNDSSGLFAILYNRLKSIVNKGGSVFEEEGNSPLQDSVIKSLANLEAKYNNIAVPFGFRDGKKTIFALTAPKFITDRVRDLKGESEQVRQQLKSISFNRHSFWLTLLSDPDFRDRFGVSHIGLTAFKQMGKKNYRDNSITKLSDLDHELTKLGMFCDTTQGSVSYKSGDKSFSTYPGTSIGLRMGTMFSPTMSDKQMMTLISTAVMDLQNKDLGNGNDELYISNEVNRVLYDQLIKPELERMIKFHQNGGKTNIKGYDKGAAMFMFLPTLNSIKYNDELRLVDAIKHAPNTFTVEEIEKNKDIMQQVTKEINNYVKSLVDEKMNTWEKTGLAPRVNDAQKLEFMDKSYLDKFRGTDAEKTRMAATDFVVNNMISNANSFMTMVGDPALYFKSKEADPIEASKESFINVGKRLAMMIAPGTPLANSEGEKYLQLFLKDRESTANNIEYLERLLGKEGAAAYRKIEGSDAQEYTTWKEHLDVLARTGKLGDGVTDITPEEITQAREILSKGTPKSQLTERQQELLAKVAQPIKPVYTGQIHDPVQDAMRSIYIKSSSFPLIPQLTAGMEIDKLRDTMEKLQDKEKKNVRASYQTANKVGALTSPMELWNEDGTINKDNLAKAAEASLELDRKGFRIQQEVPFKTAKGKEDKITLGTQIMKLLFGDEMMNLGGFNYNGKEYSGKELHRIYNDHFINLVGEKKKQLFDELGLNEQGKPEDIKKSMAKLQSILKDEAVKRGYPLQDIQGLTLNEDGNFNLPLWSSANSNRYESMLNAIVGNRLIKMKFPGNSYVVGSEEGFKISDDLNGVDKSRIIYTSAWNGKELQGVVTKDGKIQKAQVFVASKFRDRKGDLVDLFQRENGDYKYITKNENGSFSLRGEMFDKELLSLSSFRIPTSGHQSASQVEIAGFLPHESGDLMIVPRGFTKQKGLDFDVDKENTYQLNHFMNDEGKFEVLNEEHRNQFLLDYDKAIRQSKSAADKVINAIFGDDINYTDEDIKNEKFLSKLASKFKEKLTQNEIIKIHSAILSNPSDAVQSKINRVLSTDFAEEQAAFLDKLTASNKDSKYWTPLSDEYQKQKMSLGSAGKIGTGAYSLDVVFHSLAQQAALSGKPIKFTEVVDQDGVKVVQDKVWRFGKISSNAELGATKTVDGKRTISEVLAERQNIAVDNEKLQVMGRVGLSDMTLDIDKVFNMIGIDKGEDGNSVAFLFLSQPIVKEYVEMMKNASSNVADYDANKENKIIDSLSTKYNPDKKAMDEDYSDRMTNANFIQGIQNEGKDGMLQLAILQRFLEMKKYGEALRGVQTSINTDSKGLGKSFFDVIEKRNAINRLGSDSDMIQGASALIGDFRLKKELTQDDIDNLIKEGYIDMGQNLVKPTTLSGGFSLHGVSTAYDLWNKHFPYDAQMTVKQFDEILSIIGNDNMSDTKAVELKQKIFQGIKKYAGASKYSGVIKGTDDINAERSRLYIDSETNTSLASYIKGLMDMSGNKVVDTFIKSNKLFNKFEFKVNKNGEPSLIKYNNAGGEEFDEQYLYESLAQLMTQRGKDGNIELPQVGNKKYSLASLAQDLVAYSYLGNAVQEAIQFTKYIPVSYLNTIGFSQKMRELSTNLRTNPNVLGLGIKGEGNKHMVGEFTMQYIQHNPERVKYKLEQKKVNGAIVEGSYKGDKTVSNLQSFKLKGEDKPVFVSIYNAEIPKGEKKFQLYWFDGEKYSRIPVLGTFGMDEYQPRNGVGQSLVNGRVRLEANPQGEIKGSQPSGDSQGEDTPFNVGDGDAKKALDNIVNNNTTPYTELAKHLSQFLGDVKVEIVDNMKAKGKYVPSSKTIFISKRLMNDPNQVANTLIHETIHHLTFSQVNKYITVNEKNELHVNPDAPAYVSDLVRMFNRLKANVDQTKLGEVIKQARETGMLDPDDKNKYYGYTSIHEFMTMALTNKDFQDALNKIPYNGERSFLDKFKEFVANVLQAVGIKFDKNFTAAHAISNIFETIEGENKKLNNQLDDENPFGHFFDETMNNDNFDDIVYGDEKHQMDAGDFPSKNLTIQTEKCL